jgi:hypothetical protein
MTVFPLDYTGSIHFVLYMRKFDRSYLLSPLIRTNHSLMMVFPPMIHFEYLLALFDYEIAIAHYRCPVISHDAHLLLTCSWIEVCGDLCVSSPGLLHDDLPDSRICPIIGVSGSCLVRFSVNQLEPFFPE